MEITTVGELLHWSYANLAMAHSAIKKKIEKYERSQFMIRSRLYAGLNKQTMSIGPLADDERLKMVLPQACCYCGSREHLSADHLIPTKRGGANTGDNIVWACRSCNSSKCARDVLEWLEENKQFPPILLLRRYLKLATEISIQRGLMNVPIVEAPELPFSLSAIPRTYPPPSQLRLWVVEIF
ncbi:HNH endonuclease [Candidatus Symbiobacter mobilis]|uniref:Restriction endonuclease n=1 Tax=Candidatus Symbiobacter mobilis CR TaxID=946483 RepID=U5N5G4_9BURK|nr:HNH endonuclease [Candidatus Symbiobacter mobilis]AGX86756.1 restriction endonuclease [Candidatus Symbiobacter mobilis CR]